MADLVSMGECMVEFYTSEHPESAAQYQRAFGGDTLNTLVAAARLGTRCAYITRVANDSFGRYLARRWESEEIDLRHVRWEGEFNGIYFISTGIYGEREFTYYRRGSAASGLTTFDLDTVDFRSVRAFHTSGITQALSSSARLAVKEGFKRAHTSGCLTSFDLNFRPLLWKSETACEALLETISYVEICFAGLNEDVKPLFGVSDPDAASSIFHKAGVSMVILKSGIEGSWISRDGRLTHIPARTFGPAVDTTGAGDAYAGGFLHGILTGMTPERAGELGATCAGLKVLGRGAIASMPSADTIRSRFI